MKGLIPTIFGYLHHAVHVVRRTYLGKGSMALRRNYGTARERRVLVDTTAGLRLEGILGTYNDLAYKLKDVRVTNSIPVTDLDADILEANQDVWDPEKRRYTEFCLPCQYAGRCYLLD